MRISLICEQGYRTLLSKNLEAFHLKSDQSSIQHLSISDSQWAVCEWRLLGIDRPSEMVRHIAVRWHCKCY
uniref:Uncharacterized protein n=1 Tax=Anguilla anguilla TaxID=7936 RepID=A0A0E9PSK2_ANGAN